MKNPTSLARGPLLSALATAALLACHPSVSAFSLGRMTVQSTLGEPLRAEIDVASLTPEEAASLKSSIAAPDAFRAAGVEFNGVLSGAQASLQRRSDGRAVVRLVGERAVTEPFVDVILDFSWSGGRLQRSYTLLIDPPSTASRPGGSASSADAVTASPTFSSAPVTAPAARPVEPRAQAPKPVADPIVVPKPPRATRAPAPAPTPAPKSESAGGGAYRVKSGDTLSKIAAEQVTSGVSLDQMLVGLFRGNPDAFVNNNLNRLKSGVVLAVPDAQTAGAISTEEARQVIQAHSADFSAFRKRLAEAAPTVKSSEPARQGKGKLEAAVQDRKPGASGTPPDELKLTRPAVKAATPEAKVSKETERKAAESRVAELSRNVEELKKLSAGTTPAKPAAVASAPAVSVPVPVPAPVAAPVAKVASAPAPSPVASAPVPASSPTLVAPAAPSAPVAASAPRKPKALPPPPAPTPEPGFLDGITDNPFVLPGVVGLVALVAGLGVMRLRRRSQDPASETSFVESKMQADSFFGVSGGQRVDTRDGGASSSSLSYSLSQLDAIGDVDPVAEADVYLAYGRDLQAEEILKEALRSDPGRVAIRTKLMEVYVKRADTKSAEAVALQILELTGGVGDEWEKVKELGRQVEPDNGLYASVANLTSVDIDTSNSPPPDLMPEPGEEDEPRFEMDEAPEAIQPAFEPAAFDEVISPAPAPAEEIGSAAEPESRFDLDLDLESSSALTGRESTQSFELPSQLPSLSDHVHGLDSDMPDLLPSGMEPLPDLDTPLDMPTPPSAPTDSGAVEFDFGDLSLDLDPPASAPTPLTAEQPSAFEPDMSFDLEPEEGDPLQRKLELADEFRRIGDVEGARDLLEEVLSKATDSLRTRAQAMLNELG